MSDWKPDCVYDGTEYKTLFRTDYCSIIVNEKGEEDAVKNEWIEPLKVKSLRESIIDTAVEAVFARRIEGNLSPTLCRQICEALYDANAFRMPTNEYKGIKEGEINFVSETFPSGGADYCCQTLADSLNLYNLYPYNLRPSIEATTHSFVYENGVYGWKKKPD